MIHNPLFCWVGNFHPHMKKPSKPTHGRCWSIWRALDFRSQHLSNPWLGHQLLKVLIWLAWPKREVVKPWRICCQPWCTCNGWSPLSRMELVLLHWYWHPPGSWWCRFNGRRAIGNQPKGWRRRITKSPCPGMVWLEFLRVATKNQIETTRHELYRCYQIRGNGKFPYRFPQQILVFGKKWVFLRPSNHPSAQGLPFGGAVANPWRCGLWWCTTERTTTRAATWGGAANCNTWKVDGFCEHQGDFDLDKWFQKRLKICSPFWGSLFVGNMLLILISFLITSLQKTPRRLEN